MRVLIGFIMAVAGGLSSILCAIYLGFQHLANIDMTSLRVVAENAEVFWLGVASIAFMAIGYLMALKD